MNHYALQNTKEESSNKTITTLEIADMMEISHRDVLNKLQGTSDKDGNVKQVGIIPTLGKANFRLADYFAESTYKDAQGKIRKCYLVTKLGCDFLANKFTGEKGIIFTARYVKRFNEMEMQASRVLPTNYKEALKQLLEQVEENEKLQLENSEMKPKADYFDGLVERNLLTNFRTTAKELGLKESEFIEWLINHKYIYRDSKNKIQPYSIYVEKELFAIKEYVSQYSNHAGTQTLITPKGRETFRLLLKNENLI